MNVQEVETVAACQEAMGHAARSGDWHLYHQLRHRWQDLEDVEVAAQPPPEHTTRDPWPEGFAVPSGAAGLKKKAEAAGWTALVGYSRGWRPSTGRGVFVLHHYVVVQARKPGCLEIRASWRAKVTEEKLSWATDSATIGGALANVTAVTAHVSAS